MFKYNFILCFLLSTLSYTAFSSSEEPPERFAALKSASCSEFEKTLKELDEPSAPVIPALIMVVSFADANSISYFKKIKGNLTFEIKIGVDNQAATAKTISALPYVITYDEKSRQKQKVTEEGLFMVALALVDKKDNPFGPNYTMWTGYQVQRLFDFTIRAGKSDNVVLLSEKECIFEYSKSHENGPDPGKNPILQIVLSHKGENWESGWNFSPFLRELKGIRKSDLDLATLVEKKKKRKTLLSIKKLNAMSRALGNPVTYTLEEICAEATPTPSCSKAPAFAPSNSKKTCEEDGIEDE